MIIRRHIFKELVLGFLISVAGLNLILMMEKLLKLSRLLSGLGASLWDVVRFIILIQPKLMLFTIPMALLLSVLITYGRMSMDNELLILRTSGLRKRGLFDPVFRLSIMAMIAALVISMYLMPTSLRMLRHEVNEIIKKRAPLAIEPGVFFDAFKGLTVLVKQKDKSGFSDIFIYDNREGSTDRVITAKKGRVAFDQQGVVFTLKDGMVNTINNRGYTEIRFSEYLFRIALSGEILSKRKNEMTPVELLKQIRSNRKDKTGLYIELHRRFTFPLMIIVIAFLAPSLSMLSGKTGRVGGFFIAVVVFLLYYSMLLYFENLVKTEKIGHLFCWMPFLVFSMIAFYAYRRVGE